MYEYAYYCKCTPSLLPGGRLRRGRRVRRRGAPGARPLATVGVLVPRLLRPPAVSVLAVTLAGPLLVATVALRESVAVT